MSMTNEVVEFSAKGLDALQKEVKSTGLAIDEMRKRNAALKQSMNDGSFLKEAKALSTARAELVRYRQEQERLQRQMKLSGLQSQYGRVGGALAYGAGRLGGVASGAGGLASGAFSGALGTAATLGAGLGVGALVHRGFQGTSAAARLEMEMDKLARTMAEKVLPVMNGLTNNIARLNMASDRVRSGNATFGDKLVDRATDPMNIIGGIAAYKGLQFAGGGSSIAGASRIAGGLGRLAMIGRGGPAMTLFAGYNALSTANDVGRMSQRWSDLNETDPVNGKKYVTFKKPMNSEELKLSGGLIDRYRKLDNDKDRQDFFTGQSRDILSRMKRDRDEKTSFWNATKTAFGFGSSTDETKKLQAEWAALRRLKNESLGGERVEGGSSPMLNVQGAGEKRGLTDLHQELAESIAQKMAGGEAKGTTLDDVIEAINKVARAVESFNPKNWF